MYLAAAAVTQALTDMGVNGMVVEILTISFSTLVVLTSVVR